MDNLLLYIMLKTEYQYYQKCDSWCFNKLPSDICDNAMHVQHYIKTIEGLQGNKPQGFI